MTRGIYTITYSRRHTEEAKAKMKAFWAKRRNHDHSNAGN